jgi:hypothetical protein
MMVNLEKKDQRGNEDQQGERGCPGEQGCPGPHGEKVVLENDGGYDCKMEKTVMTVNKVVKVKARCPGYRTLWRKRDALEDVVILEKEVQ